MIDSLKQLVKELAVLGGASGNEAPVVSRIKEIMEPLSDKVVVDRMGNVIATRYGPNEGTSLMLAAHSDEIGAVVKGIEKNGFLRIDKIGWIAESLLVGRKVRVAGKHLGVIGAKPGHLQSEEDLRRAPKCDELFIDVGADTDESVAELGIRIGDPVVWISEVDEFSSRPHRLCGKAMDNRYPCAVLIQLFRNLVGRKLDGTVHAVFTVQEEPGLRGATMTAYSVKPDLAITVDIAPTGDTPDVHYAREVPVALGKGPAIAVTTGAQARGHILHPGLKRLILDVAEAESIPCQFFLFSGGRTDSAATHVQRGGIPSADIGLPCRYTHSPVETIDLSDGVMAVQMLEAVVKRMGELENYLSFS